MNSCGAKFLGISIEKTKTNNSYKLGAMFTNTRRFCASIPKPIKINLSGLSLKGKFIPTAAQISKNFRLKAIPLLRMARDNNSDFSNFKIRSCSKSPKLILSKNKQGQFKVGFVEWKHRSGKGCKLKKKSINLPVKIQSRPKRLFTKDKTVGRYSLKTAKIKSIKRVQDTIVIDYMRSCNMKPIGITMDENRTHVRVNLMVSIDNKKKCLIKKKRLATYMIHKNLAVKKPVKGINKSPKGKLIFMPKGEKNKKCVKKSVKLYDGSFGYIGKIGRKKSKCKTKNSTPKNRAI